MSTATNDEAPQSDSAVREFMNETTESLATGARQYTEHYVREPAKDLLSLGKEYAKEKPEVAAVWAFALGVIVGWKIKPW